MRSLLILLALSTTVSSCRRADSASPPTERERDSVIGSSQLPGAKGVQGALRVSDSADARRAREDSAGQD